MTPSSYTWDKTCCRWASGKTGRRCAFSFGCSGREKIFGMMATDHEDRLVGMLSMYDILHYVQRLFAREEDDAGSFSITGVLALSDSARFRFGSFRACTAGRLLIRQQVFPSSVPDGAFG